MQGPRGDGLGAVHVAVWVPHEQAEKRISSALAAGGGMVREELAPMWWTLADAAGNAADISTPKRRDSERRPAQSQAPAMLGRPDPPNVAIK